MMCYRFENRIFAPNYNALPDNDIGYKLPDHSSDLHLQLRFLDSTPSTEQLLDWLANEWSASEPEWLISHQEDSQMFAELSTEDDPLANRLFGAPEWTPVCALGELAAMLAAMTA